MTGFYVIEATIRRGYLDAIGPDEPGWLGQPWLAVCQIEAGAAATTTLRASDVGYRTRSTDSIGVQAYPPTLIQAFSVDVAANLDPTQTNVAAAWGTLTLANADHAYDSLVAGWTSDGQSITIYRGDKTTDARAIPVDPPYASLVRVFSGVMGAWQVQPESIVVTLRDASYYLEQPFPRTVYGGTGALDGTANLAGVSKPVGSGGSAGVVTYISNVTPLLIDPANLVYQYHDGTVAVSGVFAGYDGGVPLTNDGLVSGGVTIYSTTVAAGHFKYDPVNGLIRLGSTPVFGFTLDYWAFSGGVLSSSITALVLYHLTITMRLPLALIGGYGSGAMETYGVDAAATAAAVAVKTSFYLASGDTVDNATVISRMLSAAGVRLVPGRDGKLRLLVLSAIPNGTTSVQTFDDTNTVSIARIALPAVIDPPPWRMRLAYGRNYTVQAQNVLAGAVTAAQATFAMSQVRAAIAVTTASPAILNYTNDPPVIGTDGGSLETTASAVQSVVNKMVALWGTKRRLYEITVPQSVGQALDWASVVTVVSKFDGLTSPGKQGQIVGWRYGSGDATALFRVLI